MLIFNEADFKSKLVRGHKEGPFISIKQKVHQEDVIVNIHKLDFVNKHQWT
jgi:hypothetical protein